MSGNSKRRIGGVAITGLVIAGVIGVTSMSASGQAPPEATGPVLVPYGTLTIVLTDGDGQYELDLEGTDGVTTEFIQTNQPCATVEPGSGNSLVLSPTPGSATSDTVQIRNNAFGVNTGNTSCGSSAAAVISGDELLKIELGPQLTDAQVFAKSADLQITRVKRGNLRWGIDDGAPVDVEITQSPQLVEVDPVITKADDLFTSITIASDSRKNNEGLSVADGTSFELVTVDDDFEVAVDCGEKVTEIGDVGDVASEAVYLRGQNEVKLPDQPGCEDVGVVVEVQTEAEAGVEDELGGRVYWDNSFVGVGGTQQRVQGTVTIKWAPVFLEGLSQTQIEDILDREIDYDGPGGDAGFTDTLWCSSFTDESNFTLPPYAGPGANSDDGTAPWCLVSDERVLTNVDDPATEAHDPKPAILQTETLAGKGDPWRL